MACAPRPRRRRERRQDSGLPPRPRAEPEAARQAQQTPGAQRAPGRGGNGWSDDRWSDDGGRRDVHRGDGRCAGELTEHGDSLLGGGEEGAVCLRHGVEVGGVRGGRLLLGALVRGQHGGVRRSGGPGVAVDAATGDAGATAPGAAAGAGLAGGVGGRAGIAGTDTTGSGRAVVTGFASASSFRSSGGYGLS